MHHRSSVLPVVGLVETGQLIRENQPISRADLSRRSGLQPITVSQIVEQLIRERRVREGSVALLARRLPIPPR